MRFFVLLIVLVLQLSAGAQPQLKEVPGLPTKEVFDLLVDRNGFLWVGHDMGISRFDGVSFTHFAHPQRSSLSVTDLVEDRFGRIWFHNFSGQVFYIENEQIHLVDAYKNEVEDYFPRLILCNDEIVVSSRFGVFVCDTRTLKSQYIKIQEQKENNAKSLCRIGNKVLILDANRWMVYESGKGLKPITAKGIDPAELSGKSVVLQPQPEGDTGYLSINPTGTLFKLTIEEDQLVLSGVVRTNHFINTVSNDRGVTWLHTKKESRPIDGSMRLAGYNLSDAVTDKQGNKWFSSLDKGLLLETASSTISKITFPFLDKNAKVFALASVEGSLLFGTQSGELYSIDARTNRLQWKSAVPNDFGSVTLIESHGANTLMISASSGTVLMNPETKEQIQYTRFNIKDAVVHKGRMISASGAGLFSLPLFCAYSDTIKNNMVDLQEWNSHWQDVVKSDQVQGCNDQYWLKRLCRSVAMTNEHEGLEGLFVSLMTGVLQIGNAGPKPLVVNGNPVYSNSMVSHRNTLFIGTLNSGLLIKNGTHFKHISTAEGLFSNSIIRMKKAGKYLWIFQDKAIQLMNLETQSLVNGIELPQETGANVHDVASFGDTAILSTNNGLYQVVLKPSDAYKNLKSFLNVILTSSPERHILSGTGFRYNQNDLQFHLSIPFYSPSNSVYFKYRLKGGGDDSQWFSTLQGERIVRFASLMPGDYVFEAYAVVAGQQEGTPVTFSFTINKPWWKTITFMVIVFLLIALATYLLYRYRLRQIMKVERVRSTISGDLHDEIGSTLSSINIYSELAKTEADNKEYLDLIQDNTRDVISKLDDLVWSINPKNDSVAQLVSRMRSFAEPVFKGVNIQCRFNANDELLKQELPLVTKRNLYLIFKELVNNVVKHSRAKNCVIDIQFTAGHVHLTVADDGIGINNQKHAEGRSGMQSLVNRTRQLNAAIIFKDNPLGGTIVHLSVPVK